MEGIQQQIAISHTQLSPQQLEDGWVNRLMNEYVANKAHSKHSRKTTWERKEPRVTEKADKFIQRVAECKLDHGFQKHLNSKVHDVPAEFFLAVKLGLGRFTYQFISNATIKNKHHKRHSWKVYGDGQSGFEINFVCKNNEQVITLFKPTVVKHEHGASVDDMYNHLLNSSQAVNMPAAQKEVIEVIQQHFLAQKKQLSKELASYLSKHETYHEGLQLGLFLMAYLTCGGFPQELRAKISAFLQLTDIVEDYDKYALASNQNDRFPVPKLLSEKEINIMQEEISKSVKAGSTNNLYYQNAILTRINDGLASFKLLIFQKKSNSFSTSLNLLMRAQNVLNYDNNAGTLQLAPTINASVNSSTNAPILNAFQQTNTSVGNLVTPTTNKAVEKCRIS